MKEQILAIAGRPGLCRLVSRGSNTLILETLDEQKRRFPAGLRDRITALSDVSMYTDEEDTPLMNVFDNICKALDGKPSPLSPKQASAAELAEFMEQALPNYDRERVHKSDIIKLIQWYNILVQAGYKDFVDPEEAAEAAETEEKA